MTAGYVTLSFLSEASNYEKLEQLSEYMEQGLCRIVGSLPKRFTINRVGSLMTLFFTGQKVRDFSSARTSNVALHSRFFNEMLSRHIYLAPSQFEACFLSLSHDRALIDTALEAAADSLKSIFE